MPRPNRLTLRAAVGLVAAISIVVGLGVAFAGKDARSPNGDPAASADAHPGAAPEAEKSAESGPSAYPVTTINPVKRTIADTVRGFGTVRADARNARSVTSATVVVVSDVLVLPGERVRRGQPLLRVQPDPVAYLAYQQALSAAKLARNEVSRLTAQRADSLATATQLETAEKALVDADAAVDAARRQGAAGTESVIVAPIDGVVTTLGAVAGDRPAIGTPLLTISPLPDRVSLGIEPGLESKVHVGDHVTVRSVQTDAVPRDGRVAQVGAALDADSRLVIVSVILEPGTAPPYLAGLTVEGVISTRAVDAFSLPRAALVKDDDGISVFEILDGKAHRVRVALAADDGPRVAVTGDLDVNHPVVTTGAYELEDGVEVEERKP